MTHNTKLGWRLIAIAAFAGTCLSPMFIFAKVESLALLGTAADERADLSHSLVPGTERYYRLSIAKHQQTFGTGEKPTSEKTGTNSFVLRVRGLARVAGAEQESDANKTMDAEVEIINADVQLSTPTGQFEYSTESPPGSPVPPQLERTKGLIDRLPGIKVVVSLNAAGTITQVQATDEDLAKISSNPFAQPFSTRVVGIVLQPLFAVRTESPKDSKVGDTWKEAVRLLDATGSPVMEHSLTLNSVEAEAAHISLESNSDLSKGLNQDAVPGGTLNVSTTGKIAWNTAEHSLIERKTTEKTELAFNIGGDASSPVRNVTTANYTYTRIKKPETESKPAQTDGTEPSK